MTLLSYRKPTLLALGAFIAFGTLATAPAHAQLLGTTVTGNLQFGGGGPNYFDPANGFVPAGFSNTAGATVTITEPQVEFGFNDGSNLDTANFTDGQLIITDVVAGIQTNVAFLMTFTNSAFTGFTLSEVSDNFYGGGLTALLVGDTLTVSANDGPVTPGTFQGVFNFTPTAAAVPEPSQYAAGGMLGASLLFGMVKARRRTAKKTPATA